MLVHGICVILPFENAEAGSSKLATHHVLRIEEIDRGVVGPWQRKNDVATRSDGIFRRCEQPAGFEHPVDAREEPSLVRDIHGYVLAPNDIEGLVGIR